MGFMKSNIRTDLAPLCTYNMAIPVVEFSSKGYKIRKVFG
jgi:hypothetical protein